MKVHILSFKVDLELACDSQRGGGCDGDGGAARRTGHRRRFTPFATVWIDAEAVLETWLKTIVSHPMFSSLWKFDFSPVDSYSKFEFS
ncbi:hypothetical protein GCM10025857_19490 [Alicyclobacillus contaminans]|nr:hypothetical protein GCM10025857_19490 [Alicyclobacillus contaminans]